MRSRPFAVLALASAVSLLLVSCDAFFQTNLFKAAGLGQVSAATLAKETSAELVSSAYVDGQPSTAFFDALTDDPSAKATVLTTLEDTYTDPAATPAAAQEAAALAAQVELITTGADSLVNNVAALLVSGTDFSTMSSPTDVVSAVQALLPADLISSEATFTAAINALLAANDAYTALGTNIGDNGVAGDVDLGTAAQSAVMAAFLGGIDPASVTDPATGAAYTSPAALLWDLVQGTSGVDTSTLSFTAPDLSTGSPLANLVGAAGLDVSAM